MSENNTSTKIEVNEFLSKLPMGVIASVTTDGKPQAATVAFWSSDDLTKIVIGTSESSRKVKNFAKHPSVAFVATDEAKRCTVQLEGTARRATDEDAALIDAYYQKLPFLNGARQAPRRCHFVIEVKWARFTDITTTPWTVTETTL